MIGSTIINDMSTDRLRDDTHINTRIIKEATGVALANKIAGAKNSSIRRNRAASAAKKTPDKIAKKKPAVIR